LHENSSEESDNDHRVKPEGSKKETKASIFKKRETVMTDKN
jgi:hypothetical protein